MTYWFGVAAGFFASSSELQSETDPAQRFRRLSPILLQRTSHATLDFILVFSESSLDVSVSFASYSGVSGLHYYYYYYYYYYFFFIFICSGTLLSGRKTGLPGDGQSSIKSGL